MLLQEQPEGTERPIEYWSRGLNGDELGYGTTYREYLAVLWAILILRPYFEGHRFTIRTGHAALRWILNMGDVSVKMARWSLGIEEVELDIVHRPGVKHQAAGALWRVQTNGADTSPLMDYRPVLLLQDQNATLTPTQCVYEVCDEKVWKPLYLEVLAVAHSSSECATMTEEFI